MKLFKRISALFLVFAMAVAVLGSATAFAAEDTASANENTAVVTTDATAISPRGIGNQIVYDRFDSLPAAGNPFVSSTNQLYFGVTFSPGNGSVILSVKLYDNTTHTLVNEWQSSTGSISHTVNITAGHTYIFEYQRAYGTQPISGYTRGWESF